MQRRLQEWNQFIIVDGMRKRRELEWEIQSISAVAGWQCRRLVSESFSYEIFTSLFQFYLTERKPHLIFINPFDKVSWLRFIGFHPLLMPGWDDDVYEFLSHFLALMNNFVDLLLPIYFQSLILCWLPCKYFAPRQIIANSSTHCLNVSNVRRRP